MSASLLSGAPGLPPSDRPAKKNRRRRGSGKGKLSGTIASGGQIASSRLISLFLRSLSAKEKGFALSLLLDLAKECNQAAATPEGGATC